MVRGRLQGYGRLPDRLPCIRAQFMAPSTSREQPAALLRNKGGSPSVDSHHRSTQQTIDVLL